MFGINIWICRFSQSVCVCHYISTCTLMIFGENIHVTISLLCFFWSIQRALQIQNGMHTMYNVQFCASWDLQLLHTGAKKGVLFTHSSLCFVQLLLHLKHKMQKQKQKKNRDYNAWTVRCIQSFWDFWMVVVLHSWLLSKLHLYS